MILDYLADQIGHLPELAALHLAQWGYMNPGETPADRRDKLRQLCHHRQIPTAFVAVSDGELLGSALLVAHDMRTRMDLSPWLAGVYVKPAYRRAGVAGALLQRVEQEAVALQVPRLYLYTPSEAAYYARRGWQTLEQTEYKNVAVTVMHKALESAMNPQP